MPAYLIQGGGVTKARAVLVIALTRAPIVISLRNLPDLLVFEFAQNTSHEVTHIASVNEQRLSLAVRRLVSIHEPQARRNLRVREQLRR